MNKIDRTYSKYHNLGLKCDKCKTFRWKILFQQDGKQICENCYFEDPVKKPWKNFFVGSSKRGIKHAN